MQTYPAMEGDNLNSPVHLKCKTNNANRQQLQTTASNTNACTAVLILSDTVWHTECNANRFCASSADWDANTGWQLTNRCRCWIRWRGKLMEIKGVRWKMIMKMSEFREFEFVVEKSANVAMMQIMKWVKETFSFKWCKDVGWLGSVEAWSWQLRSNGNTCLKVKTPLSQFCNTIQLCASKWDVLWFEGSDEQDADESRQTAAVQSLDAEKRRKLLEECITQQCTRDEEEDSNLKKFKSGVAKEKSKDCKKAAWGSEKTVQLYYAKKNEENRRNERKWSKAKNLACPDWLTSSKLPSKTEQPHTKNRITDPPCSTSKCEYWWEWLSRRLIVWPEELDEDDELESVEDDEESAIFLIFGLINIA